MFYLRMVAVWKQSTETITSSGLHPAGGTFQSHALDEQSTETITSSGSHPADGLTLLSRAQVFLRMLSEATDEHDFARVMLHPVLKRKLPMSEDDITLEGPVDIAETTALMQDALELAQRARQHVNQLNDYFTHT